MSSQLVRVHNFTVSLDGFGTGEGPTFEAPFGHAGHRLHQWMFATRYGHTMMGKVGGTTGVDDAFCQQFLPGIGAEIMGRGKFDWRTGPWTDLGTEDEWRGWWGDNPPFHTPVFVRTHHPRPSFEMEGGTTFHFVDGTAEEVLEMAKAAADGLDVRIGGGPATLREYLAKGLVDLAHIVVVPVVLGRGGRLWDGLDDLEQRYDIESVSSPTGVTHLTLTRR